MVARWTLLVKCYRQSSWQRRPNGGWDLYQIQEPNERESAFDRAICQQRTVGGNLWSNPFQSWRKTTPASFLFWTSPEGFGSGYQATKVKETISTGSACQDGGALGSRSRSQGYLRKRSSNNWRKWLWSGRLVYTSGEMSYLWYECLLNRFWKCHTAGQRFLKGVVLSNNSRTGPACRVFLRLCRCRGQPLELGMLHSRDHGAMKNENRRLRHHIEWIKELRYE